MDPLSPPAQPWKAHGDTVPKTPLPKSPCSSSLPNHNGTHTPRMHPILWQTLPQNHPKSTGLKQPGTLQSLIECQHPPQKPAATYPRHFPTHQGWDRPVLVAPMGRWAASQCIRQLPHASSHPRGPTMSQINGSWLADPPGNHAQGSDSCQPHPIRQEELQEQRFIAFG